MFFCIVDNEHGTQKYLGDCAIAARSAYLVANRSVGHGNTPAEAIAAAMAARDAKAHFGLLAQRAIWN